MSKVNIIELIDATSILEILTKLVSHHSQYSIRIHEAILDLVIDTLNYNFFSFVSLSDLFVLFSKCNILYLCRIRTLTI